MDQWVGFLINLWKGLQQEIYSNGRDMETTCPNKLLYKVDKSTVFMGFDWKINWTMQFVWHFSPHVSLHVNRYEDEDSNLFKDVVCSWRCWKLSGHIHGSRKNRHVAPVSGREKWICIRGWQAQTSISGVILSVCQLNHREGRIKWFL